MLQLRLADRRGLLTGSLNEVRNFGLMMIMAQEMFDKSQRDQQQFKQRIAAGDFDRYYKILFPVTKAYEVDKAVDEATDADGVIDYTKINPDLVPNAPPPQSDEEREQLKKWIEQVGLGTIDGAVNGRDVAEAADDWEEWV